MTDIDKFTYNTMDNEDQALEWQTHLFFFNLASAGGKFSRQLGQYGESTWKTTQEG